jgi:hypothetical protein
MSDAGYISEIVTKTDSGTWHSLEGSDFVFYFEQDVWTDDLKKLMHDAYDKAKHLPNLVKNAVANVTGQQVVQGVYLADVKDMATALNSINGLAETEFDSTSDSGTRDATEITLRFFGNVLSGLGGDVTLISAYLTKAMDDFRVQLEKSDVGEAFGSIICFVSADADIMETATTLKYVHAAKTEKSWIVNSSCSSHTEYSYGYDFGNLVYDYDPVP